MKVLVYGVNNDGYIYGRLFKSAKNGGKFVIDIGEKEFNVDGFTIEVWNGDKYITVTANDSLINTDFYGNYARFKEQAIV